MTIWIVVWGAVILAAVIVDLSVAYGPTDTNRNGSKYIRGGRQ